MDPNSNDPMLYGADSSDGLVSIELLEGPDSDEVVLFSRRAGSIERDVEPLRPFILADGRILSGCPVSYEKEKLKGSGELDTKAVFSSWKDCQKAKKWLSQETGISPSANNAPFLCINDPLAQHLTATGRTFFGNMEFEDLKRMQVDIECFTADGYEFCNAQREEDRIIAIAMSDESGWVQVLSGEDFDEKELLLQFVQIVKDRDPDVIEGHNIFNFDLPYITKRAKLHKVKLSLGRDGTVPRSRPSRFNAAERTIAYQRFDIFGRSVVDTLFLLHSYDVSKRSLNGYGLKEAAIHFGLAPKGRTYIKGEDIAKEFKKNPKKLMKYAADDVLETGLLSSLLSRSNYVQAQILPYTYQNACVRGNATKIDSLMIREYVRQSQSIPAPGMAHEFAGGYTDMFVQGVIKDVHHCDVRSLYPSLMLTKKLCPGNDELGVFLKLLGLLKDFRLQAKESMQKSESDNEKNHYDALQSTFKILINSFYGYLGFSQVRFCDFEAAEKVTKKGRALLKAMIKWLEEHGATPIEIDTDGIYYVPPGKKISGKREEGSGRNQQERFREEFSQSLPKGIEIEFDGEYKSMFSYKMKNYALLKDDGEMIIKGAALKSRGLEPFQRSFLEEVIRLKLEEREDEIMDLKGRYEKAIREKEWNVDRFAKTENINDSPASYAAKRSKGKTTKRAVYELALRSEQEYRAGDQLSYYVTGEKKSVAVNEYARIASEWNPKKRDENIPYYLAKLEALYKKFGKDSEQGELF